MLRLESVTKSYGGRRVIDDVTFEVKAGETAVVIGPSGSGKSTALRLLLRLPVPDSGQVTFDGVIRLPKRSPASVAAWGT